jgi:predicted permease
VTAEPTDRFKASRPKVEDYVYREILFQGYSANRLSGLSPPHAKRAIRSSQNSKRIFAAIYGLIFAVSMFATYVSGPSFYSAMPIVAFVGIFLFVFVSGVQLSYGASAGPQIRDVLNVLPLTQDKIEHYATRAFLKTMDLPLLVALFVLAFTSFLMGVRVAIAGLLSAVAAISLGLLGIALLINVFRRYSRFSRGASLVRVLAILPVILLSVASPTLIRANFSWLGSSLPYVPVLNFSALAGGSLPATIFSMIYAALFALTGYFSFKRSSLLLLSPYVGTTSNTGEFSVTLRSPVIAIIRNDIRQLFRSPRLVGVFLLPLVFVVLLLVSVVQVGLGSGSVTFDVAFLQFVVPMAFSVSYIPYALYFSELKGYAYFKMLPISVFVNIGSKVVVTCGFYAVAATLLVVMLSRITAAADFILPVYALLAPLLASTLLSAIYFSYMIRHMAMGTTTMLMNLVYSITNGIVFVIPVAAYYVALLLGLGGMRELEVLLSASMIEIAILALMAHHVVR